MIAPHIGASPPSGPGRILDPPSSVRLLDMSWSIDNRQASGRHGKRPAARGERRSGADVPDRDRSARHLLGDHPWSRHDEAKLLVGTRGSVAIISGYLVDVCVAGWEAAGAAISLSTHNLRLIACSCGCSASRSSVRAVFGGPLPLPRIFAIWGVNRLDSAVCPIPRGVPPGRKR